jgi:hypothetical protein
MAHIRWERVDTEVEQKILTAAITSTKFCREIFPVLHEKYFQDAHIVRVIRWVREYYGQYQQAPEKHIQDVYKLKQGEIKEAEADLIKRFLTTLSERYEDLREFNVEYVLDESLKYLNARALTVISDNVKLLLEAGHVDLAEDELQSFRRVKKETTSWIDPFDPKTVRNVFDEEGVHLVNFTGKLGELLGDFDRGWFVGFMAPYKRGKTWWLQETAILSLLNKYRVAFISLEMGVNRVLKRMYSEITSMGAKEGIHYFPCFDCSKNQRGTCDDPHRASRVSLLGPDGKPRRFFVGEDYGDYKPCTYCRGKREYEPASWFEPYKRRALNARDVRKTVHGWRGMFGSRLRVKSYPRFSANVSDIRRDLDALEYSEGFIPDVIIVDYADILAPENVGDTDRRSRIDDTWKTLGGMAEERHCLMVTATQSNRGSADKRNVMSTDVAEDIRKMAHVDVMISLNQTSEEKRLGIMRVGIAAHRDADFEEGKHVQVLQHLPTGQPFLDSEYAPEDKKRREE